MERATPANKVMKCPWTAGAPKRKVASRGLLRKNCLIKIVRRMNATIYIYKDEMKIAWLTSSKETIRIEKDYIQRPEVDMLRFLKKGRKQHRDLQVAPLVVPDGSCSNQLEELERSSSTPVAENVSSVSDTIGNQPNEPIRRKGNSGVFKKASLDKLLNKELVLRISSKDLVANVKAFSAKVSYRSLSNRVVKAKCKINIRPRMAQILPEPQLHRRIEYDLENIVPLPLPQNDRPDVGQMLRRVDQWLFVPSLLLFLFYVFGNSRNFLDFQEWLLSLFN